MLHETQRSKAEAGSLGICFTGLDRFVNGKAVPLKSSLIQEERICLSYIIISYQFISYHIISYHINSYHIIFVKDDRKDWEAA